jgi:hypothetical protein
MKFLLYIAFFISFCGFSQGTVGLLYEEMPTDSVPKNAVTVHSGYLPQTRLTNKIADSTGEKKSYLSVTGLIDGGFRYSNQAEFRGGLGVQVESTIKDKWFIRIGGIGGLLRADSIFQPKSYIFKANGSNFLYTDLRGRISYTPNSIFNFQVGLDHNFIGEGNRSLFLSDYGKPYPFGQIKARFWRVEYSVLYQFFREEAGDKWKMKNGITHHISLNATKWLNFGVFESVIFQPKDTLLNRGYDAEYLNPVIFYRPQEYAIGSSDNVVLGLSFSAKYKKHMLYGQFILDEFLLAEVKAKSGWWANKYGGQIGVKGRFETGKSKSFYRLEYNFVRPYTFAHLNSGQNYGNQGMTLAHPYGANFMEILGEYKVQVKKWSFKGCASYFLRGYDKDGYSYGGNVYQPYTLRPTNYGNFIGQGMANNGLRLHLSFSYQLAADGNIQAFFENQLRYDSGFNSLSYVPLIGIRSSLWNDYRNY